MRFSLSKIENSLNAVIKAIIIIYAASGLMLAEKIPEDVTIEVQSRMIFLLFWLVLLMLVSSTYFKHEAQHEEKDEEKEELQEEKKPEEELKPYEERTFPFKIDRTKALRLLLYIAVVTAVLIQYMRFQGVLG